MNIIDIVIVAVIAISVIHGMYRGFICGVLSVAALMASAAIAFAVSGDMAAWLQGNKTLVDTLMYYTDAGSRISDLSLSLLPASGVSQSALYSILESARLPQAFQSAFLTQLEGASASVTVSQLLSQTIVSVSISILSFLICFSVSYVVMVFVVHLIGYVFELPVLKHLDSLIGGLFGFARGVLLVFIFFMLVPIVLAVVPIDLVQNMIDTSRLAPMFDSNMILSVLRGGM